ncbi:MAG: tRNA (adenosine(37)-N6)-threonylcarbamoyltransferase complex ATPase subunit type 1 TsaE [Candidatus Staskawiczbacteria bacterium]|nr:tRNA (adenosine(37)-N6)-threonylcarbamoyltransferase complex ATPase subunit type 1 TsaE [Candidatus Staskawiczbacteria bacterium]MBI3337005.1 tRNA (adenosine(37)-N6)-threonylcarbamoyltransferase complex ATPase subunit type 1 TsaE [Candidatus Staskawiczbacteria bacterium]
MQKKIITSSAKKTQELGKILAKEILKQNLNKTALVLALQGDLGGGKTTFLQGFAKGLGIKERILSPTFVILKRFKIDIKNFKNFYHIDCYRLNNAKDINKLGFKDIILNPENIVAIEWPERIKKILPKSTIIIKFDFIDLPAGRQGKSKREIVIYFAGIQQSAIINKEIKLKHYVK